MALAHGKSPLTGFETGLTGQVNMPNTAALDQAMERVGR